MKEVSPYKTTLHAGNAYWMARCAKEVYTCVSEKNHAPDENQILDNLSAEDNGFLSVRGVDKNSAQAAVIEHRDYICYAFRGTDELADWLDNINAFTVKVLFGEFHRGFWNSLEDVWEGLESYNKSLQKVKRRPVFFTGHSLGGAIATLAAAKYIHEDKPFTSVYTFGQPRVVSKSSSIVYNVECKDRFFRFHNNNDIVTRVPARIMGYSHVGTYLYITEECKIHPEPGFWFRFLDCFDGAFNAVKERGIDGVEDHSMERYLSAIKSWEFDQ